MPTDMELHKSVVTRFNKEVIEDGDTACLAWLMDDAFVNRSATPGNDAGVNGMLYVFNAVLRPALSDLRVWIHDLVAEGDKVVARKAISGVHTGDLLGIPATHREVVISSIEIVRLRRRRYVEYWEANNLASVLGDLRTAWAQPREAPASEVGVFLMSRIR